MDAWNKKSIIDFIQRLLKIYFETRDVVHLSEYMRDDISWIGTGQGEFSNSFEESMRSLLKDKEEYSGCFEIKNTDLDITFLDDNVCVVYGNVYAIAQDSKIAPEHLRLTFVVENMDGTLKVTHLHSSHPDNNQGDGNYFVKQEDREDNKYLRQALHDRNRQLADLIENIPGGIHQCKDDEDITLISMSDAFLTMFGYTKEEIGTLFDNKFMNMIHPADRKGMLESMKEQLKHGIKMELEYRVLCKDREPIWVLDKGCLVKESSIGPCFYCLLIEIEQRKQQEEELRLSLERHQVIMDQATDIIFEWDIRKDTLTFSTNWFKKFGYTAIEQNISERIPGSTNIHPDDISAFVNIMKNTSVGVPYSETEFRIRNKQGNYIWCRIRATTQFTPDNRPIKAVGVIVDIDEEKKQKQLLLDQAQRDALTGLYNKAAVQALAEQKMQTKGLQFFQALMILDIDQFKAVNDTYGHLCGDSVLSDVSAVLKNHTRSSDIVGRIGGDEYLVYLPEVKDERSAKMKVEQLLEAIRMIIPDLGAAPITCSIGVTIEPRDAIDFYTLYKHADQALYHQKHKGRNGASFYDETQVYDYEESIFSAVNDSIVSDEHKVVDEGLAQYAFRTLYEAKDIGSTISRLLEIIGHSFDVSRVYIFESSQDRKYCSNTFEWCHEGVSKQIDKLQKIAYVDDLGDYLTNFNEEGMFYCEDIKNLHPDVYNILQPQGIRSMLQCAMLDEGEFVGYVGFDECRENRSWTARRVASFKLTADVLSSFVIKHRQKQKLQK